jgi:hypothetical protein
MPYFYVYSPNDFIEGLPSEVASSADGTPDFTLTLVPGAMPTLIQVTDDDIIFDELDASQFLTNTVNIDGTIFTAGSSINTAYDLINTVSGHKVTSFHFGGNGYQMGAVDGLASTVPLTAGASYTFDTERTSHTQENAYDDFVTCFAAGTNIETQRGLVEVQKLKVGDKLFTIDNGFQPLRVILKRHISSFELSRKQNLLPICISEGSLGQGLPRRDLLVSPQHRFLLNSPVAGRMFETPEVLISAKKLTSLPGIFVAKSIKSVDYFHLVLERHELILAENAPTESFLCGPMALLSLGEEAQSELRELFPEALAKHFNPEAARFIPSTKRQNKLASRHVKNGMPVLPKVYYL